VWYNNYIDQTFKGNKMEKSFHVRVRHNGESYLNNVVACGPIDAARMQAEYDEMGKVKLWDNTFSLRHSVGRAWLVYKCENGAFIDVLCRVSE